MTDADDNKNQSKQENVTTPNKPTDDKSAKTPLHENFAQKAVETKPPQPPKK